MKIKSLLYAGFLAVASSIGTGGTMSIGFISTAIADEAPTYKPPAVGAPTRRVGGGTRSAGTPPLLAVLAPESTGYTTQAQPTLYWATSKVLSEPFSITINVNNPDMPILETIASQNVMVSSPGIQSFSLAEHGITLKPNMDYEWAVTIVSDDVAMKTAFTAGTIKHVESSDTLAKRLESAKDKETPYIYAEEGIWYDAIHALSNLINQSSGDASLMQARISMLKQVNLTPEGDSFKAK
ncbi:MAG: DUF928 domain-containing protein [Pseudomonadota bacterium]